MAKSRLEASSDGVIAIIITIMVLEIAALILSLIPPICWTCLICMILITPLWVIPDLRISRYLSENGQKKDKNKKS